MALDRFIGAQRQEEGGWKGGARRVYVMTPLAFDRFCANCKKIIRVEVGEAGLFRVRVFCSAEECVMKGEKKTA